MINVWHCVPRQPGGQGWHFDITTERAKSIHLGSDPEFKYVLAAVVATDDLDRAFERTNHIDTDWRTNHDVVASNLSKRSTSVGDLLIDEQLNRSLVLRMGFEVIE